MRYLLLALAMAFYGSTGLCATFTANGGAGSSTVGAGGDYTSLEAAAADFSESPTPVTGDYIFYIVSDITETTNVAFGKDTAGHTVTIRPAASTSATVTFANLDKNIGWDAHLAIGTTSTQIAGDQLTTTSNFVIDGSNTAGGTARNLAFRNVQTAYASTTPSIMLRVVGGCDNCQFKNLYVDNVTTSTNKDLIGIEFTARHTASAGDYCPTNGLVENCQIMCPWDDGAKTIVCRNSGTLAAGQAMTGLAFRNNDLLGVFQCVELACVGQHDIVGNTFRTQRIGGVRAEVVRHSSANGVAGWTSNVTGNRWLYVQGTPSTGAPGINNCLRVGADITSPSAAVTCNVYNNTFGGFDLYGVAVNKVPPAHGPADGLYHCFVTASNSNAIINFCHNSINMPNYPDMKTASVWERYGPISVGSNWNGTLNMFNNIIRCEQNNAVMIHRATGGTGAIIANYNTYWLGTAGCQMGSIGLANGTAPNYATFASWQASGQDAMSRLLNPTVSNGTDPGKWVLGAYESDLHFDAKPSDSFAVPPLAGITSDVDGEVRSLTAAYCGADERAEALSLITAAGDWTLFE